MGGRKLAPREHGVPPLSLVVCCCNESADEPCSRRQHRGRLTLCAPVGDGAGRQLTEEIKRREDTYGDTMQRWSSDQHALADWQRKTEALLLAIEDIQAVV